MSSSRVRHCGRQPLPGPQSSPAPPSRSPADLVLRFRAASAALIRLPAYEAEGPLISLTATVTTPTAATSALTQPLTATYFQHIHPEWASATPEKRMVGSLARLDAGRDGGRYRGRALAPGAAACRYCSCAGAAAELRMLRPGPRPGLLGRAYLHLRVHLVPGLRGERPARGLSELRR
jgi:hypothetical protein